MYARTAALLVVCVAFGTLAACYESPSVIVHKPGVYKGARDPLLAKQQSPEQQQRLRERFAQVQPDR
ncbi:MAG: hypothetical protein ACE5NW_10220 [Acidiferrobacterales bacterium]